MNHCIVHDPPPVDYDNRHLEGDFLPSLHELQCEFSRHLAAIMKMPGWGRIHANLDPWCSICKEEYDIRTNGWDMEGVNLEDDHVDRMVQEDCTCPEDSPNRWYFLKSIRHAYKELVS